MGHTLRLLWLRLRYGNRYTMNVWRRLEAQPGFSEELIQANDGIKPTSVDGLDVDVWWTPDCGHLHLERNPVVISMRCPVK